MLSVVLRQCWGSGDPGLGAVQGLLRRLDEHDPDTGLHCLRTGRYAAQLAALLGLGSRQCRQVRLAGLLHDVGKLCIAPAILNKTGPLTDEETRLIREHPAQGTFLLAPFLADPAVLDAVRSHHERFDGLGYPHGLRGDQIPLPARILNLADCFDALRSRRPYRAPLPREAALTHLRGEAGRQFDPDLVAALLQTFVPPV
jgi:putative two-component system response regulator